MRQRLFYLWAVLLISGLFSGGSALAQANVPYPPIVFITTTEIYTWDEADGLQLIAPMPTPGYEAARGRSPLVWSNAVVSPDLQYVAYIVTTPQWQDVIGQDALREGDHIAGDIYIVDMATGQSKPLTAQTNAEPRSQTLRWSLQWTPDSEHLIWLEEADSGNLIQYSLTTNSFTTLVEDAAPYYSMIRINTEDRIVVSDMRRIEDNRGYTIYAADGSLVAEVGALEAQDFIGGTSVYSDSDTTYLTNRVERVNLTTGEVSPTPNGQLIGVARNAQETSLRVDPAFYLNDGCVSNVANSQGQLVTQIMMDRPYRFSPDGRAILYYNHQIGRYVVVSTNGTGEIEETQLPAISGSVYYTFWSAPLEIFEPGPDGFYDTFSCGAG